MTQNEWDMVSGGFNWAICMTLVGIFFLVGMVLGAGTHHFGAFFIGAVGGIVFVSISMRLWFDLGCTKGRYAKGESECQHPSE